MTLDRAYEQYVILYYHIYGIIAIVDERLEELRQAYRLDKQSGGKKLKTIELQAKVLKLAQKSLDYRVQKELFYDDRKT